MVPVIGDLYDLPPVEGSVGVVMEADEAVAAAEDVPEACADSHRRPRGPAEAAARAETKAMRLYANILTLVSCWYFAMQIPEDSSIWRRPNDNIMKCSTLG